MPFWRTRTMAVWSSSAARRLGHRHRARHAHRAVVGDEVGEAERTAQGALDASAADAVRSTPRRSSPPTWADCTTAPWPCLSNRRTRSGSKSACRTAARAGWSRRRRRTACWRSRRTSDADVDVTSALSATWSGTAGSGRRRWSSRRRPRRACRGSSSKYICECAIAVSARASSRPFGVPSPSRGRSPGRRRSRSRSA